MELKSGIAEKERMRMKSETISGALQMSDTCCERLQILFAYSHQPKYFVQSAHF